MHSPSILCQALVYKIESEKSIVEVGLSLLSSGGVG